MRFVYICHPYSNDPDGNRAKVAKICADLVRAQPEVFPIAPQLFMREILPSEMDEQDRVITMCCRLIDICEEVYWYVGHSPGCDKEVAYSKTTSKPVTKKW